MRLCIVVMIKLNKKGKVSQTNIIGIKFEGFLPPLDSGLIAPEPFKTPQTTVVVIKLGFTSASI